MKNAAERWLLTPVECSGPADGMAREEVLAEVEKGSAVARFSGFRPHALVKTPGGRCKVTVDLGQRLVIFDYVEDAEPVRRRFWMNPDSVEALLERIMALPECNYAALSLFGEVAPV